MTNSAEKRKAVLDQTEALGLVSAFLLILTGGPMEALAATLICATLALRVMAFRGAGKTE